MKPWMLFIALSGTLILGFQNCSQAKFNIDPSAKSDALGKENVFDPQGDDGNISKNDPQGDDGAKPGDKGGGDDNNKPKDPSTCTSNVLDPDSVKITFSSFRCSNSDTLKQGGNLVSSQALNLVIKNAAGLSVCTLTGDFKTQIINSRALSFKPCEGLPVGNYSASLVSTDGITIASGISFAIKADQTVASCGQSFRISYDLNVKDGGHAMADAEALHPGMSTAETRAKCDSWNSPLIVSMSSRAKGIPLTSPENGIQFDILGARSNPAPHAKKQISWLTDGAEEYYFIALPNKDGQVLGIDELFGDNTQGPDGKFAANGYAALAKYDEDQDGYITKDDEIFSKLRLWNDLNRDGVSQPNELFTLAEKKITIIDLHYDGRYKQVDKYGNKTLMKSVIKTEDGRLHLLFDLWFKTLDFSK